MRQLPEPPPFELDLSRPRGVTQVLTWAANQLIHSRLDSRSANTLGYLADCALRANAAGNLEQRLARLERLQQAESDWSPTEAFSQISFQDDEAGPPDEDDAFGSKEPSEAA